MRQRPEQEALQVVCFCVLCVRPARMPPLLLPSNTKPFGVIILMLPSNAKPFGVIMVYLFHPSLLLRYVNIK